MEISHSEHKGHIYLVLCCMCWQQSASSDRRHELTGGMAAGEALASLGDEIWLASAQHFCIYLSVWETTLEIIGSGSENQTRQTDSICVREILLLH